MSSQDKAIKRFQVRNMVDASSQRDLREASVYQSLGQVGLWGLLWHHGLTSEADSWVGGFSVGIKVGLCCDVSSIKMCQIYFSEGWDMGMPHLLSDSTYGLANAMLPGPSCSPSST